MCYNANRGRLDRGMVEEWTRENKSRPADDLQPDGIGYHRTMRSGIMSEMWNDDAQFTDDSVMTLSAD